MEHKRIRILHLIDILKGGGAEEWVKELARLLDPQKFEIILSYLLESPRKTYIDEISQMGVKVYYFGLEKKLSTTILGSPLLSRSTLLRSLARHLYLPFCLTKLRGLLTTVRQEHIELIHTHLHYSFILASLLARLKAIPVVCQVPQMRQQTLQTASWSFLAYRLFQKSVKTFYTNISPRELIDYAKIPEEKIRMIKGVIDLSTITPVPREENALVQEFTLENAYPVILSIGRFVPEKGHKYSIDVASRVRKLFPRAKLFILGEGWELESFRRRLQQEGLENTIILPGYRRDLKNFYSIADIYLRTTVIEGGSLASYHAMAYGNPIVGFDTKAPTETVIHGTQGFLAPPGDTRAMADYAIRLAGDNAVRALCSQESRQYAVTNLDIRETIRSIESEYLRLCNGNNKRQG